MANQSELKAENIRVVYIRCVALIVDVFGRRAPKIPTDVRIANMYAHVVVLNICNVVLLMKMAKRLSGEIAEEHKPEPQMLVADRVRDAVMERDAVPERAGARVWAEDRAYAGRVLEEVPVELPEVIRPT
jgi:hypothetical protein